MFELYVLPALIFAGIGCVSGIMLTVCSRIFEVKTDDRIEKIVDVLPKANCGACGFAGCEDYAGAIVKNNAEISLCRPGGAESAAKIGEIMGKSAGNIVKTCAVVHCNGNCEATSQKFEFSGLQSCKAAKRFYSGNGACGYGCLGFGDCVSVCTEGAVAVKNGVAEICPDLCISCGKCIKACPNSLISLKPYDNKTVVKCSSKDNGKNTKLVCKNGCIGCKICEKKCENNAVHVVDFHAVIDYDKCTDCGKCSAACPVKAISKI